MKSIMEEASSVAKAIENAWLRAQKPSEFRVKIFQESEKNFFGFSKKSAKIAFFFEDSRPEYHTKPRFKQAEKPVQKEHPQKKPLQRPELKQPVKAKKSITPIWSDELVQAAKDWISNTLQLMGFDNIAFKTDVNRNNLIIKFEHKITESDEKERRLFSSFAHLILITLRSKYRVNMMRARVILKS